MKYTAIIDTDDFKDFYFFEDGNGKYLHAVDAGAVNGEWIALYFTECEREPMEGHWTDDGYCSCCNKQTLPLDISGYASGYASFCPNCGAKMIES